jgi:DNA-binding NarL/FixJ family response regulator
MGPPYRVVIADDHAFYRKGLVASLRASGIDVVREAANGEAAIRAVAETAPDLVLMDVNMPGVNGVEATRRLTELFPATGVVMLSVSAEEADVVNAIRAGATGYLLKESPPEEILTAIREAAAGRPVVSARLSAMLLQPVHRLTRPDLGSGGLAQS